jgi:hypothetical protein
LLIPCEKKARALNGPAKPLQLKVHLVAQPVGVNGRYQCPCSASSLAKDSKEPHATSTPQGPTRRSPRPTRWPETYGTVKRPGAQRIRQTRHADMLTPVRSPGSARTRPGNHLPHQTGIKRRQATTPHLILADNPRKFYRASSRVNCLSTPVT